MSLSSILLDFDPTLNPRDSDGKTKEIEIRDSLSKVVSVDKYLFVGGDETTSIEKLKTNDNSKTFGNHRQWNLSEFVNLPSGNNEEQEIL